MKEKMLKLYEDWEKSQNISSIKKARRTLKEASKNPAKFNSVAKLMGLDGGKFIEYFEESRNEFSDNVFTAKRKAAQFILEAEEKMDVKPIDKLSVDNFRLSYEQIDDRSNAMVSYIEAGTPNGSATEIVRAIAGGNMQLAAALTMAAWGSLSVGDRNAIMNIANIHGHYNVASGVKKDSGLAKYYTAEVTEGPIKKKGDMSKNEFVAKVFPYSDPQNTKLYSDEK